MYWAILEDQQQRLFHLRSETKCVYVNVLIVFNIWWKLPVPPHAMNVVMFGELRQTTRHSNGGNHSGCQQEVAEECARPRDHKGGTNLTLQV